MMIVILGEVIMITIFVFIMMVIVDYVNVMTRGRLSEVMRGRGLRQYTLSSFLGATPGCLGSFLNVSFYVRGLLSFGAICGAMIATSGDEAFVMLATIPKTALLLFLLLFILGIISGWLIDRLVGLFKIVPCQECHLALLHEDDEECQCFAPSFWAHPEKIRPVRILLILIIAIVIYLVTGGLLAAKAPPWLRTTFTTVLAFGLFLIVTVPTHYLQEHIWEHICKEHIWRVFLWTGGALFFLHLGLEAFNLEGLIRSNLGLVLVLSALIGIIPESGPHIIFIMMFRDGLVPFSVLLTSSIVQDGHGLLPLLSYSVKDSILIKTFNLVFGIGVGLLFYLAGL